MQKKQTPRKLGVFLLFSGFFWICMMQFKYPINAYDATRDHALEILYDYAPEVISMEVEQDKVRSRCAKHKRVVKCNESEAYKDKDPSSSSKGRLQSAQSPSVGYHLNRNGSNRRIKPKSDQISLP